MWADCDGRTPYHLRLCDVSFVERQGDKVLIIGPYDMPFLVPENQLFVHILDHREK